MLEYTYESLTYEFFSSYVYEPKDVSNNVHEGRLSFRLLNRDYQLTIPEFGQHLGLAHVGSKTAPRNRAYRALWRSISTDPRNRHHGNAVQHPAPRYWFRLIDGSIFGRPEPNKLTIPEQDMLAGYLNLDQGNPFVLNVAELVAEHFVGVETHRTIYCGVVVSHLAKCLIPDFPPDHLQPIDHEEPETLEARCLINIKAMVYFQWLQPLEKSSETPPLQWKVEGTRTIPLPCHALPTLVPLPKFDPTLNPTKPMPPTPSYLMPAGQFTGSTTELGRTSGSGSIPPPSPPRQSQPVPTPPPSTSETRPRLIYPANYIPIPPFVPPPVMDQEACDKMFIEMCRDIRQSRIDESLIAYYTYNANAKEGNIAPNAVHPSWFRFPVDGYPTTSSESDGVVTAPRGRDAREGIGDDDEEGDAESSDGDADDPDSEGGD